MTREQIRAVAAELPEEERPLFDFLAATGVRIGEALGAKWGDIEQNEDGPVFVVRRQQYRGDLHETTKTEAGSRSVALRPSLARDLMRWRAATDYPGGG